MTILNLFPHCLFIVLNIKSALPGYQLWMDSAYNLELDYVLPSNEDPNLVRYIRVSNLVLRCLSIVLICKQCISCTPAFFFFFFFFFTESSYNLELKRALSNSEGHVWYAPSYNIELKYTCDQTVKTLIWCAI